MSAGKLDRRITIQRKSVTQSASGEPVETWGNLATRWAQVLPLRGDERFSNPQLAAKGFLTFRIRWGDLVADVGPLDRILYAGRTYDITAARDVGRNAWREFDATVNEDA
jgi:SPP1 family predicted phage head-tail adaptor